MMRVIGWALKDGRGHAHILALCGDGTVVMREWLYDEWRIWNDQTLNEGSLQIQNAIASWEDAGYDRGEPLYMEIPVDKTDLTGGFHDRVSMDRLFKPFLDLAGIHLPEPVISTPNVSISPTQPPHPSAGEMWFDTSGNTPYTYDGRVWMPIKGMT